ncbi:hypothetical protein QOFMPA_00052 [Enterococcus phage vB_OCPT_Toy]|nr:hypothetical protein QOFMPA_00052 [Enterococcus phage vB_OCPT_Toy]
MKLIDATVVLNYIEKTKNELNTTSPANDSKFGKGWDAGFIRGIESIKGLVKDIIIEDEIPLANPSDMIPKSEFFRLLEAIQERTEGCTEHHFIAGIMEAYK